MDENEPKTPATAHVLGEELYTLSVEDLDERIAALQAEIARLEAEKQSKKSSRDAAHAFFKS